jgi:aldehyde dehydrogenase (NAD+)
MTVKNPKDDSIFSESLHEASESDLDKAVEYATGAFETGPWSTFSGVKRAACLNKLADLIDQHVDEIAYFESIASGRLLAMVRYEVPLVAGVFRCKLFQPSA